MSKYSTLKAEIIASIKRNGAQAITGDLLQEKLLSMIDSLGEHYQFGGLALPSAEFTPGDEPVVFVAATPGTYTDFGGLVVADSEVALLVWDGSAWSKQTTDIATRTEVSQLGQEVKQGIYSENSVIADSTLAGYCMTPLSQPATLFGLDENYKCVGYIVGNNKKFHINGKITVASGKMVYCALSDTMALGAFEKLEQTNGEFSYYGETNSQYACVWICVDASETNYGCAILVEKVAEIQAEIDEIHDEITIKNEVSLDTTYSGFGIRGYSEAALFDVSTIGSCYGFNVGTNKKFRITGNAGSGSMICAIANNSNTNQYIKLADARGNYVYDGETTSELGYVILFTINNSSYHCYILEDLNETISEIKEDIEDLSELAGNPQKLYGKKCIYLGDSISTADNFRWKGILEWIYNFKWVRDISGQLAPANGGIRVVPPENDPSDIAQKSIWYRCAENRMAIYDFDYICIFGGTNDMAQGVAVGDVNDAGEFIAINTIKPYVDDASSFADPSKYTDVWSSELTFAQCLMGCIEMMHRDYPDYPIIIPTVLPCGADYGNTRYTAHDDSPVYNMRLSERIAIMQMRIANYYQGVSGYNRVIGVPFYWGIRTVESTPAFTNWINNFGPDYIHPNLDCARRMVDMFYNMIRI